MSDDDPQIQCLSDGPYLLKKNEDVPGPRTMIGGAVLVASGCYIILRERQRRGRAAAAAVDTGD